MNYYYLRYRFKNKDERNRVIDNLATLRQQLDRDIPDKDAENNLLLATWNIRDFGKTNRRGFGDRMTESHFYIAEVISRFDFVAVQEVNELEEWESVMNILGDNWDYIATDVTDTKLGGNGERLTFAFDKRKVFFQNIAGEIVLPQDMLVSNVKLEVDGERFYTGKQFHRTPFFASFQAGWLKFDICTVHIYYGSASGKKLKERIDEIGKIAEYLGERADDALQKRKALILLGDFNIVHPEHKTMQALLEQGFMAPKTLRNPTNIDKTKFYDQIVFKTKPEVVDYVEKRSPNPKNRNAGIFDLFENLYTESHFDQYLSAAKATSNGKKAANDAELRDYYLDWRTYQFSDHMPMWVRLQTNDSQTYLEWLKTQG
ncbi:MAG: endonuclease/exonuclease/phosphatase family protein [Anaerolineales bacterium]|nr:MAG: endonuclease/exonuclease/phosphatase family protein [Anaerolineales bacterium]